ncbi:ATP-binding protein [Dactylosporangium sp. CA-139114]|uniref:ATP-binding protein n=1 Tax=Dactylosporangium sp. CA-139114 TaxID=3239931 RepID=UPI003D9591A9
MSDIDIDLTSQFVRAWPGRFRFARLVRLLVESDDPPAEAVTAAVLEGVLAAATEPDVLTSLVADGWFAVAERMIEQCEALTADQLDRGYDALELARSQRLAELAVRLSRFAAQAEAAGATHRVDTAALEQLSCESWPEADRRLREAENELATWIEAEAEGIRARLRDAPNSGGTAAAMVRELAGSSQLRAARHILDHGEPDDPGPEAVPQLPDWPFADESPRQVLRWHRNPGESRPPDLDLWLPADESGVRLLDEADRLTGGGATEAQAFAAALDGFLGGPADPADVHPVVGGHLTTLRNVFGEGLPSAFRATATRNVPLFVAAPGTRSVPELPGVGPFIIAIGPDLEPNPAGRSPVAVLVLLDLLRLVPLTTGRRVALLRLLGRRWPLAALGAGSPSALAALLGSDADVAWRTLRWLTDLAGFGDVRTAEYLAFQTALEPRVLHALLDLLARSTAKRNTDRLNLVRDWNTNDQQSAAVEAAVLYAVRDSPAAVAAFWAALATAQPGEDVTLDAMVLTVALRHEGAEWEDELREGIAKLAPLRLVARIGDDRVQLRHCGVLVGLVGVADRRLATALDSLRERSGTGGAAGGEDNGLPDWDAFRFALAESWPDFQRLRHADPLDVAALAAARSGLAMPDKALLDAATRGTGRADIPGVIAELRGAFAAAFPRAELFVEVPGEVWADVPEGCAYVALHAVLTNAVEAASAAGRVLLTVTADVDDVLIDVFDNGPGVPSEVGNGHRIFRPQVSTRGEGRGAGLHIARGVAQRVGGELDLMAARSGHPAFDGAHFRLVLPRAT